MAAVAAISGAAFALTLQPLSLRPRALQPRTLQHSSLRPHALQPRRAHMQADGGDDAQAQQAQGFFTPYSEEELASLWDVHTTFNIGADNDSDDDRAADDSAPSGLGGLHEMVLAALEDPPDEEGAE
jgi:hypothetical protein